MTSFLILVFIMGWPVVGHAVIEIPPAPDAYLAQFGGLILGLGGAVVVVGTVIRVYRRNVGG